MQTSRLSVMVGVAIAISTGSASALTITWGDNPGSAFGYSASSTQQGVFAAGAEMRAFDQNGIEHPGWRSSLTGADGLAVQWVFDDTTGELIGINGADPTPGGVLYSPPDSVAQSGPGLFESGSAFGSPFGFLAPTRGSLAGDAYGVASFMWTDALSFTIHMPVMEMQWAGMASLPGFSTSNALDHAAGVDFACEFDAIPALGSGGLLGNVICMAEEFLDPMEEYNFIGYTMQWQLTGSVSEVPVPAAIWLFISGFVGMLGFTLRPSNNH